MPKSSTNLRNRVNKLYLPKTKPLMPLFEVHNQILEMVKWMLSSRRTTFQVVPIPANSLIIRYFHFPCIHMILKASPSLNQKFKNLLESLC